MFDNQSITKIIFAFCLIFLATFVGKKFKNYIDNGNDSSDYELIKEYLLNEDSLNHNNKPNLWIHTKYELNARKWKSFGSRTSCDLNQPYIHLTIKSIIHECGNDFNVCLIDDNTFEKLVPDWKYNMETIAEPRRTQYRELGMISLLYYYGGVIVPNSFLCFKNLNMLYNNEMKTPFVSENINHTASMGLNFIPDIHFMGAKKKCPIIKELLDYIIARNGRPHYTAEYELMGDLSRWCMTKIKERKMKMLSADNIGVMNKKKKVIMIEDLFEEQHLDLSKSAIGLYIPADEILRRPKFQWFASMPAENIIEGNYILAKHLIRTLARIEYDADSPTNNKNNNIFTP